MRTHQFFLRSAICDSLIQALDFDDDCLLVAQRLIVVAQQQLRWCMIRPVTARAKCKDSWVRRSLMLACLLGGREGRGEGLGVLAEADV